MTEAQMERVCRAVMPAGDFDTLRKYGFSVSTIHNTEYVRQATQESLNGQPERPWAEVMEMMYASCNLAQKATTEEELQAAIDQVTEAGQRVKQFRQDMDTWHKARMKFDFDGNLHDPSLEEVPF